MGVAIDTAVGVATNPGATITAVTFNTGDSGTVRNFGPTDFALLEQVIRQGATSGVARVRSPLLHDDVQGIRFTTSQTPSVRLLPRDLQQPLKAQDTLTVEVSGGGSEVDLVAVSIYYSNLPGAAARLHNYGDISSLIKNITTNQVAVTASGTAGAWVDTAFNATFDLLHANTDYAILGYELDTALGVIALKGPDFGNLRIPGPGSTSAGDTTEWWLRMSEYTGRAHIPVFNSANKAGSFVSVATTGTGTTSNVTLILAELSQNLPS